MVLSNGHSTTAQFEFRSNTTFIRAKKKLPYYCWPHGLSFQSKIFTNLSLLIFSLVVIQHYHNTRLAHVSLPHPYFYMERRRCSQGGSNSSDKFLRLLVCRNLNGASWNEQQSRLYDSTPNKLQQNVCQVDNL